MSRETVMRQLDVGSFQVQATIGSDKADVGMVFVEGESGEHVVEHWVLFEGHRSPNTQQSMAVEQADRQFDNLASFFQTMQQRAESHTKVTYIRASCDYHDRIPDL